MKENKLAALSTEKLVKRHNFFKGILIGIGIAWLGFIGLIIYIYFEKNSLKTVFPLLVQVFVLPVILTPLYISLKQMDEEIKSRK